MPEQLERGFGSGATDYKIGDSDEDCVLRTWCFKDPPLLPIASFVEVLAGSGWGVLSVEGFALQDCSLGRWTSGSRQDKRSVEERGPGKMRGDLLPIAR